MALVFLTWLKGHTGSVGWSRSLDRMYQVTIHLPLVSLDAQVYTWPPSGPIQKLHSLADYSNIGENVVCTPPSAAGEVPSVPLSLSSLHASAETKDEAIEVGESDEGEMLHYTDMLVTTNPLLL